MNVLTLIVFLILFVFGLRGYINGFAKSVVSATALIFTVGLAIYLTPHISNSLENSTSSYEMIMKHCEQAFNVDMKEDIAMNRADDTLKEIHNEMIDQLKLPGIVKEGLKKYNNASTYKRLGIKNFNEYVPRFVADIVIKASVFFISWLLAAIVLYVIIRVGKLTYELPAIKGFNRILGVVLGIMQGLIFIWIMFLVITMMGNLSVGASLLKKISESKFLEFLYDTNLVLRMIQALARTFI